MSGPGREARSGVASNGAGAWQGSLPPCNGRDFAARLAAGQRRVAALGNLAAGRSVTKATTGPGRRSVGAQGLVPPGPSTRARPRRRRACLPEVHVSSSVLARRDVLRGALHLVVLAPLAAVVGCSSEPDCSDVTGLTPAESKARDDANYLNRAPDQTRACAKCALFVAPPQENACGGCSVVKGPIAPKGTCKLFVAKPA